MLGFPVELLLQLLFDALFQLLAEVLFELGFQAIAHSLRRGRSANPVLAAVGLLIIGAAAGVATCWLLPHPLFRPVRHFPWLSLVLVPRAAASPIRPLGSWRRRAGGDP